ncbi:hypothetical protein F4779DRAFT_635983 [Xylariaceae sp. FL0662B]|nr:hypothetical protein F4779DRAFT_635983 [Xylariaceae sp. FL0662B]
MKAFVLLLVAVFTLDVERSKCQDIFEGSMIKRGNSPSSPAISYTEVLLRRDDYSCGPDKPCSNGACCGSGGYCGYGDKYCGDGCMSNCDARAECGKDASPSGKKCPLNVCCSQYGFCGTTEEFCGKDCQSNCELHPKPPGIIGYYESWSDRSTCHKTKPSDMPLGALTHVNYAFAYVDPNSYALVPMDRATPQELFSEVAQLKDLKPALQVWVSVGGWTFSDNNTITQPLLGEISGDGSKRQLFADRVLQFLDGYGFDGIDIDWEYPGAPDRGGKKEDTDNYVKLMKTLRDTFNTSPRKLGLSFTIPASYCYDIHGVWDRDNQIGNLLQPHTNLTEIERAAELLWRVGVTPDKVSLGFGFYGRAFTLADSGCDKPGSCRFSTGARPGPCTGTSGYLSYYEIQDLLAKGSNTLDRRSGVNVHHDEKAAVKYFSFDSDQWVSYDDSETFKQKTDWATNIGFGGSLIWASDLGSHISGSISDRPRADTGADDYDRNAHTGLLGKHFADNQDLINKALDDALNSETATKMNEHLNENCYKSDDCFDKNSIKDYWCRKEYSNVGYDKSSCGKNKFKPICCKTQGTPRYCIWRGNPSECNGQCHPGEVNLFGSSWGGYPTEGNEKKCTRGGKKFCCSFDDLPNYTKDCAWTKCGSSCGSDEQEIAKTWSLNGDWCPLFSSGMRYCCKGKMRDSLQNCHWVGKGDCADNTCSDTEVTLETDPAGDGSFSCNWGRKKSLCCTPSPDLSEFVCDNDICDSFPDACSPDEFESDADDDPEGTSQTTSLSSIAIEEIGSLQKRKNERRTINAEGVINGIQFLYVLYALLYPGPTNLQRGSNGLSANDNVYRPSGGVCSTTGIQSIKAKSLNGNYAGLEDDHTVELQYLGDFFETLVQGILPDGTATTTPAINYQTLRRYWDYKGTALPDGIELPTPNTKANKRRNFNNINNRLFEILGSSVNRAPFRMLDASMNNMKGSIYSRENPVEPRRMQTLINNAISSGSGEEEFLQPLRRVIAIFRYLFSNDVSAQIRTTREQLRRQIRAIGDAVPALSPMADIWAEFDPVYFRVASDHARSWLTQQITIVTNAYQAATRANNNVPPANWARVSHELNLLLNQLSVIRTFDDLSDDDDDDSASDGHTVIGGNSGAGILDVKIGPVLDMLDSLLLESY